MEIRGLVNIRHQLNVFHDFWVKYDHIDLVFHTLNVHKCYLQIKKSGSSTSYTVFGQRFILYEHFLWAEMIINIINNET